MKTLWRHRSRTILTVSGSAVALFVFCFVGSVQQGMNDLAGAAGGQAIADHVPGEQVLSGHQPLAAGLRSGRSSELAGVRDVVPIQVFTNNCRASLDVIVFYGVPPKKLRAARDFELVSGNWDDFEQHQDAAVVGRAVASRRGLEGGRQVFDRRFDGPSGGRFHVQRSGRGELHLFAPRFPPAWKVGRIWSAR